MKRFIGVSVGVGAVALLSFLAGSRSRRIEPNHPAVEPPAVAVTVIRPAADRATFDYALSGRVRATEEVTLTAQVPARLTSLPVREGESFRSGQPLVIFDSPETRHAVSSAEAAVSSAAALRNDAIRELSRLDSLFSRGVASERQLELARSGREAAEAAWLGANAELASWRQTTRLSVPFDGVVVRRHVDPGALLSPGQSVLDVRSDAVKEVEVPVPESQVQRLSTGSAMVQPTGAGDGIPARVVRVDGMVDFRDRTRMAHLELAAGATLEPGASVRVRLDADGDTPGRLSVPRSSLVQRGSLTGVYVVKDGRAWLRWLRVGRSTEQRVEVLAGLDPAEGIVADPDIVVDGAPVRTE